MFKIIRGLLILVLGCALGGVLSSAGITMGMWQYHVSIVIAGLLFACGVFNDYKKE